MKHDSVQPHPVLYKAEPVVAGSVQSAPPQVASAGRIHGLDLLRGFALFGILLVNITGFAYPLYLTDVPGATGLDQFVQGLVSFVGEAKFFILFSFLFGYGLSVQMERARQKGQNLKSRYRRRLIGILGFGVFHAVFLFYGDILICYAILGAVLWGIRSWSPRGLVYFGLGWLIVAAAAFALLGWGLGTGATSLEELQLIEAARTAYTGTWTASVMQRIFDWVVITPFLLLFNWPAAMAMFAIGLAAGKVRIMQRLDTLWPRLVRFFPWALGLGLVGNGLYASASELGAFVGPSYPWIPALAMGQVAFTGPALTFCFGMMLLWAARTERLTRFRSWFRAAGRLSLTNYLGQSFVCGLIFSGFGFGLYEQIRPAGLFGLAVLIFFGQALLSQWWMRHFRYGPLEWLLRAWTYNAWPRLLRDRNVQVSPSKATSGTF